MERERHINDLKKIASLSKNKKNEITLIYRGENNKEYKIEVTLPWWHVKIMNINNK